MAKLLIFSMRDSKVEAFSNPVFCRTRAEALRSLSVAVQSEDHDYSKFAEDFALFEIGSFDPTSGMLEARIQPIHVINAYELRAQAGLKVAL